MKLLLSIFLSTILGAFLFFLGNYGLVLGFGIVIGIFIRLLGLLKDIRDHVLISEGENKNKSNHPPHA